MFQYMEQAEAAADEISKVYLKASRYISLELDQIFERFQHKHKLSEKDAYRLLNSLKDKTSLDELKEALRAGKGDKAELLAELESAAYQARLEHLQQLQNRLDLVMRDVYNQEKTRSTSHYVDLANEAYYRSIFSIQQETGLGFSFHAIDSEMIDRVINSAWSGADYSSRIWKNTGALAQDLKEELLINLLTGRTDREAADIIANKFARGASEARRLVRTESCNVINQMDMLSYEECGIETYIYVATLDFKTSKECRSLDGKRFPVAEQQPGKNCPPMHPWCRSVTICDITDEELAQMKRRARDPVTGRTKTIPGNMTYQQWYDENVKGKPEAEAKEKAIKNRAADRRQYEEYKKILGKDVPDSLDSFQEMKYNDSKQWKALQNKKGLLRRGKNTGAFAHLPERMTKKHIREVALEFDIDLKGLAITIDKNEELLRLPIAGRADSENLGGITFFPNAFTSKEELVRTLYHEKQHVLQFKQYGTVYVQEHRGEFEKLAYAAEAGFIDRMRKEGRL